MNRLVLIGLVCALASACSQEPSESSKSEFSTAPIALKPGKWRIAETRLVDGKAEDPSPFIQLLELCSVRPGDASTGAERSADGGGLKIRFAALQDLMPILFLADDQPNLACEPSYAPELQSLGSRIQGSTTCRNTDAAETLSKLAYTITTNLAGTHSSEHVDFTIDRKWTPERRTSAEGGKGSGEERESTTQLHIVMDWSEASCS